MPKARACRMQSNVFFYHSIAALVFKHKPNTQASKKTGLRDESSLDLGFVGHGTAAGRLGWTAASENDTEAADADRCWDSQGDAQELAERVAPQPTTTYNNKQQPTTTNNNQQPPTNNNQQEQPTTTNNHQQTTNKQTNNKQQQQTNNKQKQTTNTNNKETFFFTRHRLSAWSPQEIAEAVKTIQGQSQDNTSNAHDTATRPSSQNNHQDSVARARNTKQQNSSNKNTNNKETTNKQQNQRTNNKQTTNKQQTTTNKQQTMNKTTVVFSPLESAHRNQKQKHITFLFRLFLDP